VRNPLFLPLELTGAVRLPLFPVRKRGSQNTRLCQKEEHDHDHCAERKD
jgi:hypothetical protein